MNDIELVGFRSGSLTVLGRYENDAHGKSQWVCRCDCGGAHIVRGTYLKQARITHCPVCVTEARVVHIDAWYHVTMIDEFGGARVQGAAGFCVVTRDGTELLEPFWLERRHVARRPAPVLVETVRKMAAMAIIRTKPDNTSIAQWIKRNRDKITYHAFNEADEVRAEWARRGNA
jgi:hypothetical protein